MDEFREWLSDNLRYFMLGGGILVIVLVVFFSIRACSGKKGGGSTDSSGPDTKQETQNDSGDEDTAGESNPLQTAGDDVNSLIQKYYNALGGKDVDALQDIEVNFNSEDEQKILNSADYIEEYRLKDVYTKNGLSENSYVVYASFEYKCKDIDTLVPALSQLYVITDEDGELKIDAASSSDATISNYVNQLKEDDDVKALTKKIRDAYDQALQDDSDLADFLETLGTEEDSSSETASSGEMYTVTGSSVNVRSQPSTNGAILGAYMAGTKVEKLGEQDGWIQIDYNGQTGYIYSDYLQKD